MELQFEYNHKPKDAVVVFRKAIEEFWPAYTAAAFSYVATNVAGSGFRILKGRLLLDPLALRVKARSFSCPTIIAGQFWLSDVGLAPAQALDDIANGAIVTPHGTLPFDHGAGAVVTPFHAEGLAAQNRLSTIHFKGDDQRVYLQQPTMDWDLRAAETPYHSIAELTSEFDLGPVPTRGSLIEVVAGQVAAVEYASPVRGLVAIPRLNVSAFLDRAGITLGLRITAPNQPVQRMTIASSELVWRQRPDRPNVLTARKKIDVPYGAVIWCYVNYNGIAVHFGWIADRRTMPNARRAALEAFDPNLEITRELLFTEVGKNKHGQKNDLDDAVATILWNLGFAATQIGRNNRTEDAVDIIAMTPKGNIVLVECTRSLLGSEKKLPNLIQRTAQVRQRLTHAWTQGTRVLPVIVTSLSRPEVANEARQAELDGVRVLTREDLESDWAQRSRFAVDPDALFAETEAYLERVSATASLPFAFTDPQLD